MKSILGKFVRNSFAASLGVNDDWSAALSIIAIVELILIIGTVLVKVFQLLLLSINPIQPGRGGVGVDFEYS